jgi:hypothetical protein
MAVAGLFFLLLLFLLAVVLFPLVRRRHYSRRPQYVQHKLQLLTQKTKIEQNKLYKTPLLPQPPPISARQQLDAKDAELDRLLAEHAEEVYQKSCL